jgi:two-component system, cell cycle response regulator
MVDSTGVAGSLAGARILIVDDEPVQRRAMARIVEEWGATPLQAKDFAEAMRLRRERDPDIVLLDVVMPQVDGYKVAQMLKRDAKFMPIILLTGLEDLESKRRGLAAGADEFLTKPVNSFELQIRVSSMLRIKKLTDELATANEKLTALATTDPLTGLANRRVLLDRLAHEFERAKRYRKPLACLMVDIDHFKRVNDTYGHPVGDKVIVQVASAIHGTIRSTDLAGRYGGEEFGVIALETGLGGGVALGERIRREVGRLFSQESDVPKVTVSIGVATTDRASEAADALLKSADEALYTAKREGRDRVVGRPNWVAIPTEETR